MDMSLFKRSESRPLAESILRCDDDGTTELLCHGAAGSIFVKGYKPESLICTLPQAKQPPSRVVEQPTPFEGTRPEILEEIDAKLAAHIEILVQNAANVAAKKKAWNDKSNTTTSSPAPKFNSTPPTLKKGDRVIRYSNSSVLFPTSIYNISY